MKSQGFIVSILGVVILFTAWTASRTTNQPHDTGQPAPSQTSQAEPRIVLNPRDPPPANAPFVEPAAPDADLTDRYTNDPVLLQNESIHPDGTLHRTRLVKTDFKYPLLRIEEQLVKDPQTGAEILAKQTAMVADHVIVKAKPGIEPDAFLAMIERIGGTLRRRIPNSDIYVVRFPEPTLDTVPNAVAAMKAEARFVQYAEPDYIVNTQVLPNDDRFAELWGMHNTAQAGGKTDADIDAPEAWDLSTGSLTLRVGVIDTGLDRTHPDLAANILTNSGEIPANGIDDDANGYVDDIQGWDFYNNDNDPSDDHGHGTHCAGTIGGAGNDGSGVAGVCWQVSLVGLKFLSATGSGSTSDAAEATLYATSIGLNLTSNSWGGGGYSQVLKDAIDDANAAGILFVAAAGNSNSNNDALAFYPANFSSPNIISVAATDSSDNKASFSSYGATTVDLAAPGVLILSCAPGGGYANMSGTSMATPHVSGACALLWSLRPFLTHHELKTILLGSVDLLPSMAGKVLSNGRLNIGTALKSNLLVSPSGTLASSGYQAGDFAPISHLVTLTNLGNTPLPWSAANTQPWLDLSSTGGTLAPGGSTSITISLNSAAVILASGVHADNVGFTDTDAGVVISRRFSLTVLAPLTVTPATGFVARGEVGGPFTPPRVGYVLANESFAPLTWSATAVESWLMPSPAGGSLLPGQTALIVLRLTEVATTLPQGYYNSLFTIANETNGESSTLLATLFIAPDPLAEQFDGFNNDTAYQQFTFTPDSLAAAYSVTRKQASSFPTNPTASTSLPLADDHSIAVTLGGDASIPFFGASHTTFHVGSNGYITFVAGDGDMSESLYDHFRRPRISALFDDLDPSAGGAVSWKQLTDRVAVTYQNVPQWLIGGTNSFQIEMFFDGRIRITLLGIGATDGLIGLSRGTGVPSPFYESDFSNYPPTPLLVSTLADENDGQLGAGAGDSLREAIAAAGLNPGPDAVEFAPTLDGGTVALSGAQLTIDSDLTIDASGLAAGIAISGGYTSRVIEITAGKLVSIKDLTITNGYSHENPGGGILNAGALFMERVTVDGNLTQNAYSEGSGGGIYNTGILRVECSTLSNNDVLFGNGGGIWNSGILEVVNSTIAGNSANVGFGGGIFNYAGALTLRHATVSANSIGYGSGGGISCPSGTLNFENSIIAGNMGAGSIPDDVHGILIALLGGNLTHGDPKLAPLGNYGGATMTMPPLPGSPAIDTAIPLPESSAMDQIGDPRPNGPFPDLGATEAFPFSHLALVDEDGDQIDDRLEPIYHLTVGIDDSTTDSDGDGSRDAEELANMTDPLDPNSRFRIISFVPVSEFDPDNPEFIVTFTSFPGLEYAIECVQTLDFASPQLELQSLAPATDHLTSIQLGLAPGGDFLRVRRNP